MREMGLSEYCLQIDRIEIDELGGAVLSVENNRRQMTALTASRKADFRRSLEEQYPTAVMSRTRWCKRYVSIGRWSRSIRMLDSTSNVPPLPALFLCFAWG